MPSRSERSVVGRLPGLGLALALVPLACGPPAETPPNLLLVTAEDLPPEALSCYRDPPAEKGGICALARAGTQYRLAFAASASVAGEAASMLTSRDPRQHGVDVSAASFLRQAERTLAEELREGGYATAAIVASPRLNRSRRLDQGFDLYDDRLAAPTAGRAERIRALEAATDAALAWVEQDASPWFLWVHYPALEAAAEPRADGRPAFAASLDAAVARLLEGLPDQTGVVFTVAREIGPSGGSEGVPPGLGAVRIPLLWMPAGGSPPRAVDTPVSSLDIAPTLLRAARRPAPGSFDGSPMPLADEPARGGRGMPREMLPGSAEPSEGP